MNCIDDQLTERDDRASDYLNEAKRLVKDIVKMSACSYLSEDDWIAFKNTYPGPIPCHVLAYRAAVIEATTDICYQIDKCDSFDKLDSVNTNVRDRIMDYLYNS